ncbi:polysaccharide deacetylase family protein [Alkalihalobacterium chitinilyticum]|uniref:Polysaccharide deacetylase family protein n=1 Tax=Alkalihalobacterium chitinilyticum TaxID=2980103 RepID=A0ABT5VCF6_9BACI|nr:polysaccharide deacetylase family protein [Alkalihalobacterium chitinilyticum]MDE5413134.1 polysaccharide deacetylase family protein [Alkalihalobacterium chitinilyticum]
MKWFAVLLCSFLIILAGCNSESTEKEHASIEEDAENIVEEAGTGDQSVTEEKLDVEPENSSETGEMEQVDQIEEVVVPQYTLNETNFLIQPKKEGVNEKVVLLTIDDAPDQFGAEMAQILYDLDANAIFFVNGIFINKNDGKEQLKKIHELGFEIGNHTMSHKKLSELSAEEQRKEIVELNDLIEEIIGERPRFFRAPYGVNTDISKQVVEEEGMQWMNWTYGYDYFQQYTNAEALADIMVNAPELMNGANLLMHDRKWTKEALADIVTGLRNKGYEIVDPKKIQ